MIKERGQNPIAGDVVNIRLFVYSSNRRSNLHVAKLVEIYFLDPNSVTQENPDGRVLIHTVDPTEIENPAVGEYLVRLPTNETDYPVGGYIDRWTLQFETEDYRDGVIENQFNIYRDLWYTADRPIIYDMGFNFEPFKIIQGTRKHIRVDVHIIAPTKGIIDNYYYYLACLANIQLRVTQDEGDGYDPVEKDKNILFNWTTVQFREGTFGYYLLDTTYDPRPHRQGKPLGNGIYLVQFKAELGENIYLSRRFSMQIFN